MAVTNFSPLLGLALPTTGDLSGTWGTTVNDSITGLLDSAVAGTTTLSTDANVTLSTTNGAANQARNAVLLCTGSRAALRTITAPAQSKAYVVINATTGGFGVKVVGAGPTTGVTVNSGEKALIAWNGSDFVIVSSSIIDLTSEVTGTLPVANGGTGVTSSTGTGNVVLSNSPTLVTPALGTPSSATLTNATGLPISTGVSGLGAGVATFLATPSSANLAAAVTNETGSGALVFATSPTLVTPALGTPSSATLTNATGLPISTGVSGLGTGVATALAVNVGTAGSPVVNGGVLGTPSSGTLTNATGLPISTGVSGLGAGVATFLATPSSANLAAAVTGETGTGALVFATSPTLVTPALGTPSSATLTNATGLPIDGGTTGTLPIARGGTAATTASAARTNLGATTLGANLFTVTDPSAVTFPRFNADNTVSSLNAADFRTAIGAGAGSGSVTSVSGTGTVNGITLTGTVTSSGSLTLGGSLSGVSLTTQVSGTLPVANGGTGITALGTGVATFLGTPTSANLAAAVTNETGSGALVFATSPTLVTPALGTPSSGTLTNATGLPIDGGTTGTLPVNRGGTGATSLTANNVILGSGTSAVQVVAPGTSGNVLTSNGTTWASAAPAVTLAGTQTLTNKTISADNNTLSGIAASSFVLSNASGNIDGSAAQKAIPSGVVVGTTDTQTLTNKTVEAGVFTNGYTEETVVANTSTAYTIDLANGTVQYLTLTGNCTYTFPTPVAGKSFILVQKQDATGSRTVTWPASVDWPGATAPTLTATASKADKFVFTAIDGSNWLGSVAGQNYTV